MLLGVLSLRRISVFRAACGELLPGRDYEKQESENRQDQIDEDILPLHSTHLLAFAMAMIDFSGSAYLDSTG